MATVIDITNKIKNEEKFIKFGEKTYKVDDRKNTVIKAQAILAGANSNDMETIGAALAELIGAEAVKDFDGLPLEDYLIPFYAVMACVNGKSYEETEEMFRNAANNA